MQFKFKLSSANIHGGCTQVKTMLQEVNWLQESPGVCLVLCLLLVLIRNLRNIMQDSRTAHYVRLACGPEACCDWELETEHGDML